MDGDPVLVTGSSSGIGRATAQALAAAGHTVYASARQPSTLADLAAAGARTLALDVTDEGSMRAAVAAIEAEHRSVGTLVNNAGYGVYGPVEEVAMDDVRRQFETNVFGLGGSRSWSFPACALPGVGGSSTCRRWAGAWCIRQAVGTTPASTRWRR